MAFFNDNPQQENTTQHPPEEAEFVDRFRAMMEGSTDIFCVLTLRGEVQEISPSWHNFTGQEENEYRGRGWLEAFHPADQPQVDVQTRLINDLLDISRITVRQYIALLRKEIGSARRPRRYAPAVSEERKRHQRVALSSRRATWLVLRRPEDLSLEEQHLLDLLDQAHPQVKEVCELAQTFVQMIRRRNAQALEAWLQKATTSEVPEVCTFAKGILRDQAAVLAALTYDWSQGQVEGHVHRLKLLKRQPYGRAGFDLLRHRVLARSA